jgi:hypothetical protein
LRKYVYFWSGKMSADDGSGEPESVGKLIDDS